MNSEKIVQEIIDYITSVGKALKDWTIGVTDNTEERKAKHKSDGKNVSHWKHWDTGSEAVARAIEKALQNRGMQGDVGGGKNPTYIYVF